MKRILLGMISIFVIGLLVACGSADDDSNDTTTNNETTEETDDTESDIDEENDQATGDTESDENEEDNQATDDDMGEKMKELDYAEFELEVEYSGDKEYEAEIEKDSSGAYTAELEDELNNIHVKGNEAFDEIYPLLEKVSINPDSSQDEVFDEMLQAFNLDSDYEEIEVEITFQDGTELEYEVKNN